MNDFQIKANKFNNQLVVLLLLDSKNTFVKVVTYKSWTIMESYNFLDSVL